MSHEKTAPQRTMTRRGLLETGACAMAAVTAPQWLAGCGAGQGTYAEDSRTEPLAASQPASELAKARLPKRIAGIRIPDTRLAQAAADLALSASPETLYNHCIRTYLFAALVFRQTSVRYDEELTFVAAALHDLGLVDEFMTPNERFEVDGADAAVRFLEGWHVPARWSEIVWDAIALHTSVGIVTRKAPEIASVAIGAGLDATGQGLADLAPADVAEVVAAYPRLAFKTSSVAGIISYCERKPNTLLLHPWESVARRPIPDLPLPFLEDVILSAPFAE